ncbi:MAG TPA: polysaccharide deacetylase family protein [Methylomirabilota bacterium]|nr:polysaccharide deacetylase family protein [Methylomirabilota bacterium]
MIGCSKIILSLLIVSVLVLGTLEPPVSFSQVVGTNSSKNKNYTDNNYKNYHLIQPKSSGCNCVVFRMDDVQDNWIQTAQLATMNLFISKNQSLTLGLIMNGIGNDTKIIGRVNNGYHNGLFELALHGWDHVDYTKLNEKQQQESLKLANEKMLRLFGNRSDIFITPYGPFNNGTIYAMNQLGVKILSAALPSEGVFDKNSSILNLNNRNVTTNYNQTSTPAAAVYHIPAMTFFKNDEHNKRATKTPINDILSIVDNTIKKFGYSVIVFHPQDFVKTDQNGNVVNSALDTNQLKDLSRLIDSILSKGIKIVSFSKLISEIMSHSNASKLLYTKSDTKWTSNSNNTRPTGGNVFSSLDSSETQQWINHESNTKIQFGYLPAVPIVGNSTELRFIVKDLKTGNNLKNLTARVTILSDNNNSIGNNLTSGSNLSQDPSKIGNNTGISTVNINSSNGDFIVKHKFLNSGIYQVIVRVNSDKYALALVSFDIYII